MKAQDLVNDGTFTIEELRDYIDGTGNYQQTQKELNEVTGFESTKLDLVTNVCDEDITDDDILNADLIEEF